MGEGKKAPWRRGRLWFARLFPLFLLAVGQPSPWGFGAGLPLVALGEGLRIWSAGILRKQEVLATTGPYAHTRNPLYLGTFLTLLGGCLLSGRWWSVALLLPLFALFYGPTVGEEERFLKETFGSAYEEYACRVPRWGWRWRGVFPGEGGTFSWEQVRRNREGETALMVFLWVLLFGLRGTV